MGHQRLSVIDVSPAGSQPMVSDAGRFVIAFNGEIYNHNEIRYSVERGEQQSSMERPFRY